MSGRLTAIPNDAGLSCCRSTRRKGSLRRHGSSPYVSASGFTLIEILVTLAVISLLIALTFPMMAGALGMGRSFRCRMGLRSIAFDFAVFADNELHGDRGNDEMLRNRFRLATFIESQYGIDEFWRFPLENIHGYSPDEDGNDPMRCPEVSGTLAFQHNTPCNDPNSINPAESISYTFNLRLYLVERVRSGYQRLERITLDESVLQGRNVPLVWDLDGHAAKEKGQLPSFSTPSLEGDNILAGDVFWFPSYRHSGESNIAFTDGHVSGSHDLRNEPEINWAFQGER